MIAIIKKMVLSIEDYQTMNATQRQGIKRAELQTLLDEHIAGDNRVLTQPLDYDYVTGRLKGLGLNVIVSLNVGLR